MEYIIAVIVAFFFYFVILPLFGLLVGLFIRVLFPYSYFVLLILFLELSPAWYLLAGAWLLALLVVRRQFGRYRELHWTEGHYEAVPMLLTLGLFMKRQTEEWAPPEGTTSSLPSLQARR